MAQPWDAVLGFWFPGLAKNDEGKWVLPPSTIKMHFGKSDAVDAEVKEKFTSDVEHALGGGFAEWEDHPEGCLAKTLLVDQFTRHIYRDTPAAFSGDEIGVRLSRLAHSKGYHTQVKEPQVLFFFLPLMHSEKVEDQAMGVQVEKERGIYTPDGWGQRHYDLVAKFGRFPHRNVALGRESTPEELEVLKNPKNSF
eukprot:TRINITY_DN2833_c0_g1_i2.p1 TRINITY_DN2833_c0_g1~~TRINITY_DN2833_c0_g1_i2.p1  ORF type:complete len:229 (+),score=69.30 TRINITY_DN2833_c0_g1_i2:103-687(+)